MTGLWLKNKFTKVFVTIILMFIVSAFFVAPQKAAAQTNEYYDKHFEWDYNGQHWTWNLSIPVNLYDAYRSVPVSTRTQNGPAGYGFCTTTKDAYIQTLAKELNDTANEQKFSSFDKISFVLAFVQSLPYTSDQVTTGYDEYPRFPIETLVDDGGDCEDTSILFATLTLILGYGTVYINPPNHYAVGILGNDLRGTYWTYPEGSNKTYYYCETTGNGFMIGQLPDEFSGQSAFIYPIDENKQYIPSVAFQPNPTPLPTSSTVTNPSITPKPTQDSTVPVVPQPSVEPVLPLSFNIISENPLLFVLIIFAIAVSLGIAIFSGRKPKLRLAQTPAITQPSSAQSSPINSEGNKFCIFCGSNNKQYASYCESCGKKIE